MAYTTLFQWLALAIAAGAFLLALREGWRQWQEGDRQIRELKGETVELERTGRMGPHLTAAVALGRQMETAHVETREWLRTQAFADPAAARRWESMLLAELSTLETSAQNLGEKNTIQSAGIGDPCEAERAALQQELISCRALLLKHAEYKGGGAV